MGYRERTAFPWSALSRFLSTLTSSRSRSCDSLSSPSSNCSVPSCFGSISRNSTPYAQFIFRLPSSRTTSRYPVLLLTRQLFRFFSHTLCPVKLLLFFLSCACASSPSARWKSGNLALLARFPREGGSRRKPGFGFRRLPGSRLFHGAALVFRPAQSVSSSPQHEGRSARKFFRRGAVVASLCSRLDCSATVFSRAAKPNRES